MQDIYVGRQPIYGRRLEVYAYELLYRGGPVDFADFEEGDRATSQVLLNAFNEFGVERVVGSRLAFVNLTRGFIIGEYPLPLPRSKVVLEVLEDVPADEEVIAGLRALRKQGYRIALDDFIHCPATEPLLPLSDIVKVDVLGLSEEQILERVGLLRTYGPKLLAEKIESREQFEVCQEAGFEYFQGYFLARPSVLQGVSIPSSRLNLLRLLADLLDPDCAIDRVQEIVSQDVTLSYRLLRHINAAKHGLTRRIESIRETVLYLGLSLVRNLASLFLLSQLDDTPHELLVISMMRARMCENLARAARQPGAHQYFTVGLFSTLDVLLGAPMAAVLSKLPLAEEPRRALLEHTGPLGEALSCAIAYEQGNWDLVRCLSLPPGTIKTAFLDTVAWVEAVDRELLSDAA